MKKTIMIALAGLILAVGSVRGQVLITTIGSPVTTDFDSMGTSATATLPTGFRVDSGSSPTWAAGTTATTVAYGTTGTGVVTGTSAGGVVNWANGVTGTATDRALGFLNTGSFTSPRSIMFALTNNTGVTITALSLSWDYEKYRSGSRAWDWTFYSSPDGSTWTPRTAGDLSYAADANNTVVSNPPQTTSSPSFTISGLSIADGTSFYLRWNLAGVGGSTNGQGLAIDNFSVTAIPEPSTYALLALGLGALILLRRRPSKA